MDSIFTGHMKSPQKFDTMITVGACKQIEPIELCIERLINFAKKIRMTMKFD